MQFKIQMKTFRRVIVNYHSVRGQALGRYAAYALLGKIFYVCSCMFN